MAHDSVAFGTVLRRLRMAAALSQQALAERAGLSLRGISDLERGVRRTPHLATVRLLADALALNPEDRQTLLAAARAGNPPEATAEAPPNSAPFPLPLTPLIGRERQLAELCSLLGHDTARLVTLAGTGGMGKTRLALAVAEQVAPDFSDGVVFVSLAPLGDPAFVASAIAERLGVREGIERTLRDALAAHMVDRHMLLLLDNFEHLLPAATLVAELLGACPSLRVMTTSRAALRLSGEQIYPVPPLMLPAHERLPPLEELAGIEAIRLFVDRARAARPGFALSEATAPAIAKIVSRLDGLPLAIELAAARVGVLPPVALLARLDRSLALLTGGAQDLPARQRTLRDTIAWSFDLLPPNDQALFRRLAVFAGGWTLGAAECVTNPDGTLDVLEGVASLVDKSLVGPVEQAGDEPRFTMLETVRAFALERLAASDEDREIRRRHASWCVDLAEEVWPTFQHRSAQAGWIEHLQAEHDNVRTALAWLAETGDAEGSLRLAGALLPLWFFGGHATEGRRWLDHALASGEGTREMRARALLAAGYLAHYQGDDGSAVALLERGLALFRALGDAWGESFSLLHLGIAAEDRGDYARAGPLLEEALRGLEATGSAGDAANAVYHLGVVAYGRGEPDAALAFCEEALRQARRAGDGLTVGATLNYVGLIACARGDLGRAADALRELLILIRTFGHREALPKWLANVGVLAVAASRMDAAARLFGAADGLAGRLGLPFVLPERDSYERESARARAELGAGAFQVSWNTGRSLSLDGAVAEAEAVLEDRRVEGRASVGIHERAPSVHLTQRERDVLRLLATGKSDREIADALFITYRTTTSYVAAILRKLDAPSRTAAAAWAVRHGLA